MVAKNEIARHIFVKGIVQGVGFRAATEQAAKRLRLTGWVKNLPDSRVEIFVQGDDHKVQEFVGWVHRGPERSKVEHVDVQAAELDMTQREFMIRRT